MSLPVYIFTPKGEELKQADVQQKMRDMEAKAAEILDKVTIQLMMDRSRPECPFFANIGLGLKLSPAWHMTTAATDGRGIQYNPSFICGMDLDENKTVFVHEVMHVVLKHFARRGHRDPKKANIAMDLEANWILEQAGFKFPKGFPGCIPGKDQFAGMPTDSTMEHYYELIPDSMCDDMFMPGCGEGIGDCADAGDESEQRMLEQEIDGRIRHAKAQAGQRGFQSAGLELYINNLLKPVVQWWKVLQEFVSKAARTDYTYNPPNRRYMARGLYLPSLGGKELGDVVFGIDASGSCCTGATLERFNAEARGVCELYNCRAHIYYHDVEVHAHEIWEPGDPPLVIKPRGGGGTSHRPLFERVQQDKLDPAVMICLTDMESDFPETAPDFPVLWANVGGPTDKPGWGRIVEVKE